MPSPAKAKPKVPAVPTDYVVLERVTYEDEENETAFAWTPLIDGAGAPLIVSARTKKAAIDGATEEDRAGVFRAIAASSWRGGEERFEQTKLVGKPLDE